jgi:hypothetical protein
MDPEPDVVLPLDVIAVVNPDEIGVIFTSAARLMSAHEEKISSPQSRNLRWAQLDLRGSGSAREHLRATLYYVTLRLEGPSLFRDGSVSILAATSHDCRPTATYHIIAADSKWTNLLMLAILMWVSTQARYFENTSGVIYRRTHLSSTIVRNRMQPRSNLSTFLCSRARCPLTHNSRPLQYPVDRYRRWHSIAPDLRYLRRDRLYSCGAIWPVTGLGCLQLH